MKNIFKSALSAFLLLFIIGTGTDAFAQNECTNVLVTLNAGGFPEETSWDIYDSNGNIVLSGDGVSTSVTVCLPDGCYTVAMHDSFGDGWNGAVLSVVLSNTGTATTFTLDYGDEGSGFFGVNAEGCVPEVPGCTDPLAINYNAAANTDNGSCEYCNGEGSVLSSLYVCTFGGGNEVELQIVDDLGNEIISVSGLGNSQIYYFDICLQAGTCYTVNMTNSAGNTGWYGGYYWVNAAGVQVSTGSLGYQDTTGSITFSIDGTCGPVYGCTDPTAYNYDAEAEVNDGSCLYAGCTDATALNYDYYATIDDGSCEYCEGEGSLMASLYVCAYSNGSEIGLQIVDDEGNELIYVSNMYDYGVVYYNICLLPGECYTAIMTNTAGNTGWYGGYFWVTAGNAQLITSQLYDGQTDASVEFSIDGTCGPLWGCTDPNALNYNPLATANDGSCQYPWYGCTDPNALNYDLYATADDGSCIYPEDCEQNSVIFVLDPGIYPGESSYSVLDENGNYVASGGGGWLANGWACVADGCYTIYMYDSFGDGWDSGSLSVYVNGNLVTSVTLATGTDGTAAFGVNTEGCTTDISGCTDPAALNYNWYATVDDGSCVYPEECDANLIYIYIYTQAWGSEISWNLVADDGTVVASGGGYDSWGYYTEYACVADGCYSLQMNDSWGDGWNGGYYYITGYNTYAEGSLFYGDSATDLIGVNTTCEVDGCTDPEALNYNPWATTDDGSCLYNDNDDFGGDGWWGLELDLELYPNPTNEDMTLFVGKLNANAAIKISITSITGQVMETVELTNNEPVRTLSMNVADLSSGYYFLQITNGERTKTAAFIRE